MTRKNFEEIAEILRRHDLRTMDRGATNYLMHCFIEYFEKENHNFQKGKFIKACDLGQPIDGFHK